MAVPTHHDCRLSAAGALHLLLHIRAILDILPEIADVAADLLVGLERERDNRDEAECEPFPGCVSTLSTCRRKCGVYPLRGGCEVRRKDVPPLHHAPGEVAAVLALHGDVLCALELAVESVCSAGEEEEHVCDLCALLCTAFFN